MKFALTALTGALVLLGSASVSADPKLAMAKGCLACHAIDQKVIGPAFKDVAAKYKGNDAALASLATKVREGGKGTWGDIPMPPNPVSEEEATTLVKWVLSQ